MIKVHYIYKIVLLKGSLEQYYYIGKKSSNLPKYIQDKEDYFEYIRQNPDFDSYSGSGRIVRDYFKKYTTIY